VSLWLASCPLQGKDGGTSDAGTAGQGADMASPAPPELLAALNPCTDLASLVERVCRNNLRWVVVSQAGIAAWEDRDQAGWARVQTWLAERQVTIIRI
jgi:hypothetical protein